MYTVTSSFYVSHREKKVRTEKNKECRDRMGSTGVFNINLRSASEAKTELLKQLFQ